MTFPFHSAIFYTHSIPTIIDFYTKVLNLKLKFQSNNTFASFTFPNNVRLGIKKADKEREIPGAQTIILSTTDIVTTYVLLQSRKCTIYKPLTTEDWGKNFSILDPDGNKVEFVEQK